MDLWLVEMERLEEDVPSPSLPLGGPWALWMQAGPLRAGAQARAAGLQEPGVPQLQNINTFHMACWRATGPA